MKTLSKEDAINILERIISEIETLPKTGSDFTVMSPWKSWSRTTAIRIQRIFGTGSSQLEEVEMELAEVAKEVYASSKLERVALIVGLIKSMIVEVSELWEDEPLMVT